MKRPKPQRRSFPGMTPFGAKVRALRDGRGVTQKAMASALGVSAAYLSALEHGQRGRPSPAMVRQICAYFGLMWDDADQLKRLAQISHPRIVVDTGGLSPKATELANLLAERIGTLDDETVDWLLSEIMSAGGRKSEGPTH